MKRTNRAAIERAIWEITEGELSSLVANSGFKECADGLEMIRDRTKEKPFDYAAFTERFLKDFRLWIKGQNGEVFFRDPFAKNDKLLLREFGEFREPLPKIKRELSKVLDNLSEWTARPEFKRPTIPGKQNEFTVDEVAEFARVSRRQVEYDIENRKLQVERKGRRIIIPRKNLLSYAKEKRKK